MKDLQGIEIKEAPEEVGAAIALPKNSDKTAEFNKVIKKMQENGEMDKLVKKWFGSEKISCLSLFCEGNEKNELRFFGDYAFDTIYIKKV